MTAEETGMGEEEIIFAGGGMLRGRFVALTSTQFISERARFQRDTEVNMFSGTRLSMQSRDLQGSGQGDWAHTGLYEAYGKAASKLRDADRLEEEHKDTEFSDELQRGAQRKRIQDLRKPERFFSVPLSFLDSSKLLGKYDREHSEAVSAAVFWTILEANPPSAEDFKTQFEVGGKCDVNNVRELRASYEKNLKEAGVDSKTVYFRLMWEPDRNHPEIYRESGEHPYFGRIDNKEVRYLLVQLRNFRARNKSKVIDRTETFLGQDGKRYPLFNWWSTSGSNSDPYLGLRPHLLREPENGGKPKMTWGMLDHHGLRLLAWYSVGQRDFSFKHQVRTYKRIRGEAIGRLLAKKAWGPNPSSQLDEAIERATTWRQASISEDMLRYVQFLMRIDLDFETGLPIEVKRDSAGELVYNKSVEPFRALHPDELASLQAQQTDIVRYVEVYPEVRPDGTLDTSRARILHPNLGRDRDLVRIDGGYIQARSMRSKRDAGTINDNAVEQARGADYFGPRSPEAIYKDDFIMGLNEDFMIEAKARLFENNADRNKPWDNAKDAAILGALEAEIWIDDIWDTPEEPRRVFKSSVLLRELQTAYPDDWPTHPAWHYRLYLMGPYLAVWDPEILRPADSVAGAVYLLRMMNLDSGLKEEVSLTSRSRVAPGVKLDEFYKVLYKVREYRPRREYHTKRWISGLTSVYELELVTVIDPRQAAKTTLDSDYRMRQTSVRTAALDPSIMVNTDTLTAQQTAMWNIWLHQEFDAINTYVEDENETARANRVLDVHRVNQHAIEGYPSASVPDVKILGLDEHGKPVITKAGQLWTTKLGTRPDVETRIIHRHNRSNALYMRRRMQELSYRNKALAFQFSTVGNWEAAGVGQRVGDTRWSKGFQTGLENQAYFVNSVYQQHLRHAAEAELKGTDAALEKAFHLDLLAKGGESLAVAERFIGKNQFAAPGTLATAEVEWISWGIANWAWLDGKRQPGPRCLEMAKQIQVQDKNGRYKVHYEQIEALAYEAVVGERIRPADFANRFARIQNPVDVERIQGVLEVACTYRGGDLWYEDSIHEEEEGLAAA